MLTASIYLVYKTCLFITKINHNHNQEFSMLTFRMNLKKLILNAELLKQAMRKEGTRFTTVPQNGMRISVPQVRVGVVCRDRDQL